MTLTDKDTKPILNDNTNPWWLNLYQCSNASVAIWWPRLQSAQVVAQRKLMQIQFDIKDDPSKRLVLSRYPGSAVPLAMFLHETPQENLYPFTFCSQEICQVFPQERVGRKPHSALTIQRFCLGRLEPVTVLSKLCVSDVAGIQMPRDKIGNDCKSHFFEITPHKAGKEATFRK